jgi:hypothetical protein
LRLAWCTDIHLDFVENPLEKFRHPNFNEFIKALLLINPEVVLITGDISIAPLLKHHLTLLEKLLQRHVLYVLGNHDFYGGSFSEVRNIVTELNESSNFLKYISDIEHVRLSYDTAMIGHDCWYDAVNGDYQSSPVIMSDWHQISDFHPAKSKNDIVSISRAQANLAAKHIQSSLEIVVKNYNNVIVLTHVPPFLETCSGKGRCDKNEFIPWYTCPTVGKIIFSYALKYPKINFQVFSGHIHGTGEAQLLPNLIAKTNHSTYGTPRYASIITI